MRVARALPIAAVVLAACGMEHLEQIVDATVPPPIDGGLPDAAALIIAAPIEPAAPTAPAMPAEPEDVTPPSCPMCDAPPNVDQSGCAEDEARFPSGTACERIGTPCPVGQWPEDLPAKTTITYVDPAAPPGGDGSIAAPFLSVAAAIAIAPAGSIIALSKGELEESIVLQNDVTLWGACTAMTHVHNALPETASGVITVIGGATIKNLRISGARPAIYAAASSTADVRDVIVDGASLFAIFFRGPNNFSALDRVVVKNTNSFGANYGDGVNAGGGSWITAHQVVISRSRAIGLSIVDAGTFVMLTDAVIADTRGVEADGSLGFGVWQVDADLSMRQVVLERNRGAAIVEQGTPPRLELVDSVVRDTLPGDNLPGWGLWMVGVPTASVARTLFDHTIGTAVRAGENVRASFADVVISDTARAPGGYESAMQIDGGAHVELARAAFFGNTAHALDVDGSSTRVAGSDLRSAPSMTHDSAGLVHAGTGASVTLARARAEQATISGISVEYGSADVEDLVVEDSRLAAIGLHGEMNIRRMRAERNRFIALALAWPDARGVFEDITIDDTASDENGRLGRGVSIEVGAHATFKRMLLRGNHNSALYSGYGGANATIEDLTVEDTHEEPATGFGGQALLADRNGFIDVTRAKITGSTNLGIVLTGSSAISARDLLLADTKPGPMGYGIGFDLEALDGFAGRASITRAIFDHNTLASIACEGRGEQLSLTDVVVKNTQPGLRGEFGRGVVILSGAHAFLERTVIEANREIGLQVALDRASLEATDLVIRDTTSNTNGVYGRGMSIELSASATIARARIEHNDEIGIAVAFDRSSLKATDLVVATTQMIDCPPTACTVTQGGYGVAAYGDTSFVAERFLIADNTVVGLTIGDGGTADLSLGEISGNRLGVNIDTDDFDVQRLADRVIYRNNERDLDANQLPVPESTNPLPPMMH